MKKFLLLGVLSIMIGLTGCDKDNDDLTSLVGTSWKATFSFEEGGTTYYQITTIEFTSETSLTYSYSQGETEEELADPEVEVITNSWTYLYTPPVFQMTLNSNEDNEVASFSGTVSGNKITLKFDNLDVVLIKQ